MRLLEWRSDNELSLTNRFFGNIPSYAILSHTWGADENEVTFDDLKEGSGRNKAGYTKIRLCGEQARRDGLQYFWVDTCCIDKRNSSELEEAIRSMFVWYSKAEKCYVYLSDVSAQSNDYDHTERPWESAFRQSKWFTRGWTLQELLAPRSVEFFSQEGNRLGDRNVLKQIIHEVTGIPIDALRGKALSSFSIDERLRWAAKRETQRSEDKAYCLWGIFDICLHVLYGEGDRAVTRLRDAISNDPQRAFIRSFSFPEIESRRYNIAEAGRDTCNWLFRHGWYQDWRDGAETSGHNVLWIQGKPGSGKSVCMKKAFLNAKASLVEAHGLNKVIVVGFFFNARGENLERCPQGLCLSILNQIFEQVPNIPPDVMARYQRKVDLITPGWKWTEAELREILHETLKTLHHLRYRFYIDALDECVNDGARKVVGFLSEDLKFASLVKCDLRLCVSSRHYPNLQIRSCRKLVMEDHNLIDIDSVISNWEPPLGDDILSLQSQIRARSSGVFLWVVLVVQKLCEAEGDPQAFSNVLRSVPPDLEKVFQQMIECIPPPERHISTSLIFWILFAKRPLSLEELQLGLVFQERHSTMEASIPSNIFPNNDKDTELLCRKWSRGLVEVKRANGYGPPIVQFIHESVREFVLEKGLQLLQPELAGNVVGIGNDRLARSCFNYLKTRDSDIVRPPWPRPPFLEYVKKYAFTHAEGAEKRGMPQRHIIEAFSNLHENFFASKHQFGMREHGGELLSIASSYNLVSVVEHLLAALVTSDATSSGQEAIAKLLLEKWVNISSDDVGTAEHITSKRDFHGIVEAVMRHIPNNTMPIEENNTHFHESTSRQLNSFITTLLGMTPDGTGMEKRNRALLAASSSGYRALVSVLLDKNASLAFVDDFKCSQFANKRTHALEIAATCGHSETVRTILRHHQSRPLRSEYYEDAYNAARSAGRREIVEILETAIVEEFPSLSGRLLPIQARSSRAMVRVYPLSGNCLTIHIHLNVKVIDLKKRISDIIGWDQYSQYLVHCGRLVREDEVLWEKGIREGSKIYVLLPIWSYRPH